MLSDIPVGRVYLACGSTDLRRSIDVLAVLVQEGLGLDPFSPALFVFCNRRRDKLKILYWEHNGFWLYYRRLERGRFQWPPEGSTAPRSSPGWAAIPAPILQVAIGQVPPPSPRWRDLRWLVLCPRQRLIDENRSRLEALLEANPTLNLAYDLTQWFRRLLKGRRVEDLGAWLEAATGSQFAPFRRLSWTLTEDLQAIREAVQQPWSTGPVEGHIHRLKLLTRLGYGRASLPLLRARVLAR